MTTPNSESFSYMPIHLLNCFPSGLTVASARLEAEKRLKQGLANNMVQALNHVSTREIGLRWNDALLLLQSIQENQDLYIDGLLDTEPQAVVIKDTVEVTQSDVSEPYNYSDTRIQKPKNPPINMLHRHSIQKDFLIADLQHLLNKYPMVGYDGFCNTLTPTERTEQKALLSVSLSSFTLSYHFLKQCKPIRTVNKKVSAIQLAAMFSKLHAKQHMSKKSQPISVGAVIMCALEHGFTAKQHDTNAYFNISNRSPLFDM